MTRTFWFAVALMSTLVCLVCNAQTESKNDSADPAHEITSVKLSQNGDKIAIDVEAAKDWNFDTLLIFVRSAEVKTGYEATGRVGSKFDFVIQGGNVNKFAGASSHEWTWKPIGSAETKVDGNKYHVELPANLLGTKKIEVGVWAMSSNWSDVHDIAPDEGWYSLVLKNVSPATSPAETSLAEPRANRNEPARTRFKQAGSYYCYYGADRVPELSHYDINILHIPAQSPENVRKLSGLGVVTVGYISVGEDEHLRVGNGKGPGGKASWYFDRDKDGQPDSNTTWRSYFANAGDPEWRKDRLLEAKKLVEEYGFDGFFLDTIEVPDIYPESRPGMIQLVEELRHAFPDKVIVVNRAFHLLSEPRISSNIDGVMFESFTTSYDFDTHSYIKFEPQSLDATRTTIERDVAPAIKQYGLRVLALDYCDKDNTEWKQLDFDRAVSFGFLPCVGPISIDDIYDTRGIVGKSDPKYLTRLATAQTMSVKLDAPRNGFPAGTVVEPSSCFMGYSAAAVVDGIKDRAKLPWSKANWASDEPEQTEQSLLIKLGAPVSGGTVRITFAKDGGQWYPSHKMRIEVRGQGASSWQLLQRLADNRANVLEIALPTGATDAIRITQEPGGGSDARPNLMWVGQVEIVH